MVDPPSVAGHRLARFRQVDAGRRCRAPAGLGAGQDDHHLAYPAGRPGRAVRRGATTERCPGRARSTSATAPTSCPACCGGRSTRLGPAGDRRAQGSADRIPTATGAARSCCSTRSTRPSPTCPTTCWPRWTATRSRCPAWSRSARQTECLVIITSNGERTMPPAFLRRCVTLELDDDGSRLLRRRRGITLRAAAATRSTAMWPTQTLELVFDAEKAQRRPPSMAEYLDTLRACLKFGECPGSPLWERIEEVALRKTRTEADRRAVRRDTGRGPIGMAEALTVARSPATGSRRRPGHGAGVARAAGDQPRTPRRRRSTARPRARGSGGRAARRSTDPSAEGDGRGSGTGMRTVVESLPPDPVAPITYEPAEPLTPGRRAAAAWRTNRSCRCSSCGPR